MNGIRKVLVSLFCFSGCCLTVAPAQEASVVQIAAETRQGVGYGSGVVLDGQQVATVRHVVEDALSVAVIIDGRRYPVKVVEKTSAADGAVILEGDFPERPGLQLASGPPPIGDELKMFGFGARDSVESYAGTVTGGVAVGGGRRELRGNLVDAKRVVQGDSGGPAVDAEGQVAGLVMLGSPDGVVLCSWTDLSTVARRVSKSGSENVVTVYTSPHCRPCEQAKTDFRLGEFASLAVTYSVKDVRRVRSPAVKMTPTFEYRGRFYSPEVYRAADLKRWIQEVQGAESESASTAVPKAVPAAVPAADPAIDSIDWTGVRFGVLVSSNSPDFMARLKAPVQRALDVASGNQVPIEVFREGQPEYESIREAIGVSHNFTLYPFATLDKVADVGLVKGLVLRKLEAAFDGKLEGEKNELMPDLIFRRVSSRSWQAVTAAMGAKPLRSGLPPPAGGELGGSHATAEQRSWAESLVAFVFGLMGAMKTIRSVRGFYEQQTEKLLEESEAVVSPEAALDEFFTDGKAAG